MKPGELERLSMAFDRQMHELENEIMSDIVRRIKINGEVTRAADWQINRLYELGMAKKDIKNAIQKHLQLSDDEIEQMFRNAAKADYARNAEVYKKSGKELIPFEENETLKQLVSSVAEQTGGEMKNISQSLGFAVRGTDGKLNFKPIAKYYQNALDKAITGIATGTFDYNTALKKAVAEMVKSGLRVVDYESGWSSRVEVAARRAVMTGFSQITGKINEQNAEELETDMFEVTWHGGARPSHQVWQGRWYTKAQLVSVCGLGTVTGLHGANCYHDYYPVVPGVSEPTYTEAQLKEMNAKENAPVEYCGKTYTKYEALQRQRKLETTMRAQRQQIKLLEDGGADEDDIINARCRYRGTSQEYSRFSKAMGIPQQRERVTIDGLGNIGVGKYTKAVAKSEKSGIIDSQEMFRKGYAHRRIGSKGQQIIDKPTYNKLTKDFRRNGGIIIRGEQAQKHLSKRGAYAAYLPSLNAAVISDEATVSDVLEEMYHALQDRNNMFGSVVTSEVQLRREIDAQKYLLGLTEKYRIPDAEVKITKRNLAYYEEELNKLLKKGE